jgi:hypothetical protein
MFAPLLVRLDSSFSGIAGSCRGKLTYSLGRWGKYGSAKVRQVRAASHTCHA